MPDKQLKTIPEIVRRHLEEAGVAEALIVAPKAGGTLEYLSAYPNAAVLRLYPSRGRRPGPLPQEWLQETARWVEGGLGDHDQVLASVDQMEFTVSLAAVTPLLEQCQRTRPHSCDLVGAELPIPPPVARWGEGWRARQPARLISRPPPLPLERRPGGSRASFSRAENGPWGSAAGRVACTSYLPPSR